MAAQLFSNAKRLARINMGLFGTCLDTIHLNVESGYHTKQSGKMLSRKKRLLIKENLDTDLADSDASIVLQDIKSQTFNNLTLSNKKRWQRRMGNIYGKMFS